MIDSISDLRSTFSEPPMSARPLMIMHSFDRWLRMGAGHPPREDWTPPTDADEIRELLTKALSRMTEMGFGGAVVNVDYRDYLQDEERWRVFLLGFEIWREAGLRLWLYDERGYPSGAAGGLVLQDHPELEAEVLVRKSQRVQAGPVEMAPPTSWRYTVRAVARLDGGELDITRSIGEDGVLRWEAPGECEIERYDVRPGFEGTHASLNVCSARRYINVLNPDAVERFFDLTYKAYFERLGERMSAVEAFFTDEPSFMAAYHCKLPERFESKVKVQDEPSQDFDWLPQLPWRKGLQQDFAARWRYDLLPELRSLFEGDGLAEMRVRHDFHQLLSELYASTYFGRIQDGLKPYGIPFSGHVLAEESVAQHVAAEGSLMGVLKEMEKPGIDMLAGAPETILRSGGMLSCKYGSSAAHVQGRNDVMSEVSDWIERNAGQETTLEERRGGLALQSVLGITTFANYFGWRGIERADVRRLMDFCARVHLAVRNGTHVAPIAVLYPIRTAWAHYIPVNETLTNDTQPEPLRSMDGALTRIARSLFARQYDFDFVDSRSLMHCELHEGSFRIADESYEMLLIPLGAVLCPEDIETVRRIAESGGGVLAAEPLSQVRLPEDGESPLEVLTSLAKEYPATVRVISLEEDWLGFVEQNIERELTLSGDTDLVFVRQSRFEDGDVFLIVNTSAEPVSLGVSLSHPGGAEVWDPTDARIEPLVSEIEIEGYGARLIVRRRSK